ncbi:hypothetical protein [Ruminococcus flavefaciens]|uniref:hypothetical protein n=1 Tax=Ruminococcus flavefaciens TaxID=1265 RepID=UPI00048FA075|nr:hypothetical protein [Ruminococcus flavefaciens]
MPAYISMTFEYSRLELDYDNMKELLAYIKHAGLEFKSGSGNCENETIEDILEYNQKKLEQNFVLGSDESRENDYKQMIFGYEGFSEIRGYISNNYPADREYSFTLLFKEEEVAAERGVYKTEAIAKMKNIASLLWILPKTRTVQTEFETSDGIRTEQEIKDGAAPSVCPLAIVSEKQFGHMDTAAYTDDHIYAGGVLIMHKDIKLV